MNLRIVDDVLFRILGDEAVILNLSTGVYFGLDDVGTRIWQLLSEHGSTEKILQSLRGEYEVEDAQLRRDVDDLIRRLADHGLVQVDAEETPLSR